MFLGTSGAFLNNSMQNSREKARIPSQENLEMTGVAAARGKTEWNFREIRSSARQTWLESASDSEQLLQLNFCVFASCDDGGLLALREKSKFSDTFARAYGVAFVSSVSSPDLRQNFINLLLTNFICFTKENEEISLNSLLNLLNIQQKYLKLKTGGR